MFFHFWQKFENKKWPPFLGSKTFFENCQEYIFGEGKIFFKLPLVHSLDTLWVEIFNKIALSGTVKEIEANLCFPFLAKIRKFKMAAIFGEGKIFLKFAKSTFLKYPVGRKFRRNRSI